MYRRVQETLGLLRKMLEHLRTALLADDTRTMGTEATEAMAIVDACLELLKPSDTDDAKEYGRSLDADLVSAGRSSLNAAWNGAEKVGLATSVVEMRERILELKTSVDYADAYLQAAIGWDRGASS